jgi:hypothetical protein
LEPSPKPVFLNTLRKDQLDLGYCVWIIINNSDFVSYVISIRYIQALLIVHMALVFGTRPHETFSNILADIAYAVFREDFGSSHRALALGSLSEVEPCWVNRSPTTMSFLNLL